MAIMYPIYKTWNEKIFADDILYLQHPDQGHKKHYRYRKEFEFRTRLPKNLNVGDKIYIYEPKTKGGSGKVIGEFTVGQIIQCGTPFGASAFIVHFCKHILKNDVYAKKIENALQTDLPGYKQGYILKYALDDDSIDYIKANGDIPPIVTYLHNKQRNERIAESERVWQWTDEWLRKCGYYSEFGTSNYQFAIAIQNPVKYNSPKDLSEFKRLDGTVLASAPQSHIYVQ
jgi:predicted transcriptional regulator